MRTRKNSVLSLFYSILFLFPILYSYYGIKIIPEKEAMAGTPQIPYDKNTLDIFLILECLILGCYLY